MTDSERDSLIQIWRQTVDVQQHFNDLELRVRNIAATLLVAVVGVATVALREGDPWIAFSAFLAGLVGWYAFFLMDYAWYHRLLLGSVKYGQRLEEALESAVGPGIPLPKGGLTLAIGEESPYKVPNKWYFFAYKGKELHSSDKMRAFYTLFGVLLGVGVVLSLFLAVKPSPSQVSGSWRAGQPGQSGAYVQLTLTENDGSIEGSGGFQIGKGRALPLKVVGEQQGHEVGLILKNDSLTLGFQGTLRKDTLLGNLYTGYQVIRVRFRGQRR